MREVSGESKPKDRVEESGIPSEQEDVKEEVGRVARSEAQRTGVPGRKEPEEWRACKGWRAPRCTVLLTGRSVSDLGFGRTRLPLGAPGPTSQRSTQPGPREPASRGA